MKFLDKWRKAHKHFLWMSAGLIGLELVSNVSTALQDHLPFNPGWLAGIASITGSLAFLTRDVIDEEDADGDKK